MTILKRSIISVVSQKEKNLLLLMLILILGVLIFGSFLMINTFNNSTTNLRNSLPAVVTIEGEPITYENIDDEMIRIPRQLIHDIGGLPQVKIYDYSFIEGIAGDFKYYYAGESVFGNYDNWFRIFGVSNPEIVYFENGMYELVQGRTFTAEEMDEQQVFGRVPILVSDEWAQLNNIALGDAVNLFQDVFELPMGANLPENGLSFLNSLSELWDHDYNGKSRKYHQFEVIGIFEFTRELSEKPDSLESVDHYSMINLFFTPNWLVYNMMIRAEKSHNERVSILNVSHLLDWDYQFNNPMPMFVLDDMLLLDEFTTMANEIIYDYDLPLHISDLSGTFGSMVLSVMNLNNLLNIVLFVAIGAMAIILTLLVLLYIRGRRNELGVYLALGEKRGRVVSQVLLEILIVSSVGIIIAFLISSLFTEQLSTYLITNQLYENARGENYWPSFLETIGFAQEMSVEEMLYAVNIAIDLPTILTALSIIFGTILVSTFVPVAYLLEQKPMDLLAKGKIE